jgi:ZU5 domain
MSLVRFACCYAVVAALAVVGLPACSDSPRSAQEELPEDVSAPVGAKGGQLRAAGVTLDIPEGALEKTLKITATNVGKSAPSELRTKQVSDTYEFGPEGTTFNKDVTVTFLNKTMDEHAEVYFTKEGGKGFEIIKSEKRGEVVSAKVRHFSQGFLGVPLDDALDAGDDAGEATPDPEPMDAGEELDSGASMDALAPDAGTEPSDAGPADASAPDSALPTTHIVVNTRDVYGALVNQTWAAFQDGKGNWQVLPTPAQSGVYEFDVVNSAFAVALVCSSTDQTNSWGTLRYATTASTTLELGTPGSVCTTGTPAIKHTLSGKVAMPSGYWYWRYGHAHEYSPILSTGGATTTPSFTLNELVHDEPNDVLFTTAPGTGSYVISKIAIRRDVRPTADMDAGVDFDLVDGGVAPQGNPQVQVLGGSGDAGTIDVHYLTRATEIGLWLNTSQTNGIGTRTASFATLPESIRRSTDLYFARGAEETSTEWRRASLATYPSGALTLTLPASFAITFAALGTPYLRPTFDFAPVPGASKYAFNIQYSPVAGSNHRFDLELDPAWLGGSGQALLSFPDLSTLPGFNSSWVAPSAASVSAKAAVHSFSSDGKTTLKSESGKSATVMAP